MEIGGVVIHQENRARALHHHRSHILLGFGPEKEAFTWDSTMRQKNGKYHIGLVCLKMLCSIIIYAMIDIQKPLYDIYWDTSAKIRE